MTHRLIAATDQLVLQRLSGGPLVAATARLRTDLEIPPAWRLAPDGTSFYDPTGLTPSAIAAYDAGVVSVFAQTVSRQKDYLATIALIVRARNIGLWNAMTPAARVVSVNAEADTWVTLREWVETSF